MSSDSRNSSPVETLYMPISLHEFGVILLRKLHYLEATLSLIVRHVIAPRVAHIDIVNGIQCLHNLWEQVLNLFWCGMEADGRERDEAGKQRHECVESLAR
jgi:hypothetical protein